MPSYDYSFGPGSAYGGNDYSHMHDVFDHQQNADDAANDAWDASISE